MSSSAGVTAPLLVAPGTAASAVLAAASRLSYAALMTQQEWHIEAEFRGVPSDDEVELIGELVSRASFVNDVVRLGFTVSATGFYEAMVELNRVLYLPPLSDLMVSGVLSGPVRVEMLDERAYAEREVPA